MADKTPFEKLKKLGLIKIGFNEENRKKVFEITEEKETRKILIGKCPFCERRIRGTTHNQLDWNLSLHIKQKHKDDPDAKVLLNQIEEQHKTEKRSS